VVLITVVESFVAQTSFLDSCPIGTMTISIIMTLRIMTFRITALNKKGYL